MTHDRWSRREVLKGAGLALGTLALPLRPSLGADFALPEAATIELQSSPLVYVSPLRRDGQESTCHGEVWFFWDQGSVALATDADSWKSRAVKSGHQSARVWVGDFGPVGKAGDKYRSAPTFLAHAARDQDPAAYERLLAAFAKKYASSWGKWESSFRDGLADGSRFLIRYTPKSA